jgi:hypothetical protein
MDSRRKPGCPARSMGLGGVRVEDEEEEDVERAELGAL